MKKAKYYYNKQTLRFERIEASFSQRLLRVFGFISTAFLMAIVIVILAYQFIDSPKEKQLKREKQRLQDEFVAMNSKMEQMERVLQELAQRDDNIYRVIFETEPIPSSVRKAGIGGSQRYRYLDYFDNAELLKELSKRMDRLKREMYVQSTSYDEIIGLIKNKEEMLGSIPAIQPISNKSLEKFSSGFGYRIHPIYKTQMMHTGVDFTAPTGTEIYCTGNGVIEHVEFSYRGYGNHVIVNHGFGFKTIYAHMHTVHVRRGQKVSRGDVLGTVGNTGTSTAPHLHYEVVRNGVKVDPINYFYNDLTEEEYSLMLNVASSNNQSFD